MLYLFLVMAAEMLPTAGPSAAALPPGEIKVLFTWSPQEPLTGQPVTFTSTSAAGTGNAITAQQWDLDDDGKFDDHYLAQRRPRLLHRPGSHVVTLGVVDSHNRTEAKPACVPTPVTVLPLKPAAPAASFGSPRSTSPRPRPSGFSSTITDLDSPIAVQRWDLDGNGSYGDAAATCCHAPPSRGRGSYVDRPSGRQHALVPNFFEPQWKP